MQTRRGRAFPAPFLLFAALICGACGDSSPQRVTEAQQPDESWNKLRSYSGSGDEQVESFTSDTGALRIEWQAKPKQGATTPGTFRVALHSAISGRPLTVPIDHRGPGTGTAFVSEEPRVFFLDVRSQDLDWTVTVSERLR
jgi:hypothetical protein